jgi:DNA sulfur modification protein DndD
MFLRAISLRNFGAYQGEHHMDLTTSPGRPVVLIGGLNGCGKTTLLDAIQLALYGARARTSGRGGRSYNRYLRDCINRQADPAQAEVIVEFSTITEGTEQRYQVCRNWVAADGDRHGSGIREALQVSINGEFDPAVSQNWADHVETLFPLEIASLFFFDGEKIESLADPDRAAPVIESAVHALLGVSVVEQLRTDLLVVQRRQKVPGEDAQALREIKQIEDDLTRADHLCATTAEQMEMTWNRLREAEARCDEAEAAFSRQGGVLYQRRGALEVEKQHLADQLRDLTETLAQTLAADALPLALLRPHLVVLGDRIRAEQAAAQSDQVVQLLAERDHLLLEILTPWMSGDGLAAAAAYLSEDRAERAVDHDRVQRLYAPPGTLSQLAAVDQVLAQQIAQARDLLSQAHELRQRLEHVERQLAGVPATGSIAAVIATRDAARDQVTRLNMELDTMREELATARHRRDRLRAQREQAYKQRAEHLAQAEDAARIIAYADRTRDTLAKYGKALLHHHIGRLEVAVLDSFTRLMRKAELVRDLRIDTDRFTLTLVGPDGEALPPSRLSAGERQLLAVSLLWGLARVAGNRLPSVIDTPLGRLDSHHRRRLVDRYFPHASHQVLLLSTDEEIDAALHPRLSPFIARAYTLAHDDETLSTSIEAGYRWAS